jgi:hypothetical protein
MSRDFVALLADGSERFAASMSNDRARLFFEVAKLLERYVGAPSGIEEDKGEDEYRIHADQFYRFFELVHAAGWITEPQSFVAGWASYAAGMIENFTLSTRVWRCRDGSALKIQRYVRDDELPERKA